MNLAQQADRPIVAKFNGYDDFRVSCGTIPGLLRELSASTEHRHKEVVRVRVSALVQRLQRNGRPLEVVQRSIESILTRWTPAEDDASFKQDHSSWAQLDGLLGFEAQFQEHCLERDRRRTLLPIKLHLCCGPEPLEVQSDRGKKTLLSSRYRDLHLRKLTNRSAEPPYRASAERPLAEQPHAPVVPLESGSVSISLNTLRHFVRLFST
jgi:hypothetical protein